VFFIYLFQAIFYSTRHLKTARKRAGGNALGQTARSWSKVMPATTFLFPSVRFIMKFFVFQCAIYGDIGFRMWTKNTLKNDYYRKEGIVPCCKEKKKHKFQCGHLLVRVEKLGRQEKIF